MKHNKQSIDKNLKALEAAVKMEADIREVIAKMRHYKQVNSRFTDAIKEKGYWAYICKDKYRTRLTISCNQHNIDVNDRVDFTIYVSELMERCPITWDLVESELVRHKFQERLATCFQQMKCFEAEKVKFKELCEFMDKMEFKCFDLHEVKRKLNESLDYANKNQ